MTPPTSGIFVQQKRGLFLGAVALACALALAGCGKSNKPAAGGDVMGVALTQAFANADANTKAAVADAQAAFQANNFGKSFDILRGLSAVPGLTKEQTDAVQAALTAAGSHPRSAP